MGLISILIIIGFYFLNVTDIFSLVVFGLGLIFSIYHYGLPPTSFVSAPEIILPEIREIVTGFWSGTLPQLPLTLGNAVLATSLLISDLFDRKVSEQKLVTSMGIMCIVSSPLGIIEKIIINNSF